MRDNPRGAAWRFAVFTAVCLLGTFSLFAVFSQLRFDAERAYRGEFASVSGLQNGDFVRIAGVEVGKVKDIAIEQGRFAVVEFSADESVVLTKGTRAVVRFENLIGDRYLELEEGAGSMEPLKPGGIIPMDRTQAALDLDALIGGFRPLFRALDPDQVNALTGQLISAFQGQGATIGSFLAQTGALTNTLADRDDLIGQVIDNLNAVLGSLSAQSKPFADAIASLSDLVNGLAERRTDVSNAVAHADAAASTIADLLTQARPPLQNTVHQGDRTAAIVVADHDYVDDLLRTLPDSYRVLARQGLTGDFFSFYLCDAALKVNGKNGQPVYIKLAGQDTGRCTPK